MQYATTVTNQALPLLIAPSHGESHRTCTAFHVLRGKGEEALLFSSRVLLIRTRIDSHYVRPWDTTEAIKGQLIATREFAMGCRRPETSNTWMKKSLLRRPTPAK